MTISDQSISSSDLGRMRALIYAQSGINLTASKKMMLEQRLRPRLRTLALNSYREYCKYVFSERGQRNELVHLLDAVTTNKTDFFREPGHFDYLTSKALPEMLKARRCERTLLIWSAGCSSGEEPYTLAMVLNEYATSCSGFRFRILATDLCTAALARAHEGVFSSAVVEPVPKGLRQRYFLRSRDPGSNLVRVVPELRELVEFRHLNFMDSDYGMTDKADAIFCRNVIIYFDRVTQEQILRKLVQQLVPGGYLFLGHSETLHGMDLPLIQIGPAAYRKTDARS